MTDAERKNQEHTLRLIPEDRLKSKIKGKSLSDNDLFKNLCAEFHVTPGTMAYRFFLLGARKRLKHAPKSGQTIEDRQQQFYQALIPFVRKDPRDPDKYSKEMLRNFYDYWTEPTPSGSRLKFEMEKTWELSRRLKKWSANNFDKKRINNEQPLTKTYEKV